MKINLPNPNDYLHKEDQFWDQLELSLYHAKKAWEKVRKTYIEYKNEDDDYPWLSFSLGIENKSTQLKKLLDETIDPDFGERQEIAIEINEL